MLYERTRDLDPEFIRLVAPLLPPPDAPEDEDAPIPVEAVREGMARMKVGKDRALNGVWKHLLTSLEIENVQVAMRDGHELEIRVSKPANLTPSQSLPVYYSMHGGGFLAGNNDTEDLINRQIAFESNVVVFSIDYRLAPEHDILTTIYNDAEDGMLWAYKNASKYNGDVAKGFVVGESGIPIKGCLIRQGAIMVPGASKPEWQPYLKSMEENADAPLLNASSARRITKLWNIDKEKLQDPWCFPIFASSDQLKKFPRTYLVGAGVDPTVDEVRLFQKRLNDAGVDNRIIVYDGLPHGFHAFHVLLGAQKEMVDTAGGVSWLYAG